MRRVSRIVGPINSLMRPASDRQRGDADALFDKMIRQAEAASGGTAAGDEAFLEEYRFLVRQVARVDSASALGWMGIVGDIRGRMTNRFRVRRLIAENPAILDEPIERPIVVTGMPRTATTLAHKILAWPEENRAPLMWELQATDRADVDEKVRRGRIKVATRSANFGHVFSPVLPQIHAMEPLSPEECVFALPHGRNWLVCFRMPGYRDWLSTHDFQPDYEYYKQVLQVLQYGTQRRRWVLKSPYHLEHLDVLLKVFPDAKIMWTHRDPNTVIGSWCSLMETGVALCNRTYDPHVIGKDWLEMLAQMVNAGRDMRTKLPRDRVVDVSYHQLTANPHEELPGIFKRLEMDWTARDEGNLETVLARPGMKRGHEYSLGHYGLDPDKVDAAFGDYARMVNSMR
ncbi:Sulfotransferase family protein [Glycomyces harbinensis]|uniref:Sulfotransferase family protein n=2 Tax=Glycomyces harbinensis TaxID=58114 RepID=A0A1G6V3M5_9ACTN|nr:Sulfotransferase family protein [Glycomyces harbinensis]